MTEPFFMLVAANLTAYCILLSFTVIMLALKNKEEQPKDDGIDGTNGDL